MRHTADHAPQPRAPLACPMSSGQRATSPSASFTRVDLAAKAAQRRTILDATVDILADTLERGGSPVTRIACLGGAMAASADGEERHAWWRAFVLEVQGCRDIERDFAERFGAAGRYRAHQTEVGHG